MLTIRPMREHISQNVQRRLHIKAAQHLRCESSLRWRSLLAAPCLWPFSPHLPYHPWSVRTTELIVDNCSNISGTLRSDQGRKQEGGVGDQTSVGGEWPDGPSHWIPTSARLGARAVSGKMAPTRSARVVARLVCALNQATDALWQFLLAFFANWG